MLAVVALAQTRLARHPATAGQVVAVTVAQRQVQTGLPIRAVAAVVHKQLLVERAALAS